MEIFLRFNKGEGKNVPNKRGGWKLFLKIIKRGGSESTKNNGISLRFYALKALLIDKT